MSNAAVRRATRVERIGYFSLGQRDSEETLPRGEGDLGTSGSSRDEHRSGDRSHEEHGPQRPSP